MKKRILTLLILMVVACNLSDEATPNDLPITKPTAQAAGDSSPDQQEVPHTDRWGIYRLKLDTLAIEMLFSSPNEISGLRLNKTGDRFVFTQNLGGESSPNEELFTLSTTGGEMRRKTDNEYRDLYPTWSPDGSQFAFLSDRSSSLGIYVMDADGSNTMPLLDSSAHEADIDWVGDQIAFTKDSSIWVMQSDGTSIRQITSPPRAGEWGDTNLPYGDYDPRISPDGSKILFERLLGDQSPHGNYDLFYVDSASDNEVRLTQSGFSQGLASWSHSGAQIVYIVAAIDTTGQYDLYMMNADGTENRNITPSNFPPEFLCHWAVFSNDDSAIYFIGEWWASE